MLWVIVVGLTSAKLSEIESNKLENNASMEKTTRAWKNANVELECKRGMLNANVE